MGSLAHRAPSAACCGRVMQYSTNICRAASRVGDPTSLLRSGVAKATEPRFAREAGTGDAVDLDGNVSARHGGSASPSWKPWASAEFLPEKTKEQEGQAWVHFVGIGGAGLAPLAVLAKQQGWHVTGSDVENNARVREMRRLGIEIWVGHSKSHLYRHPGAPSSRPACVTVSSAVASTNPEVQEAFRLGIPVVDRRQWMPAATHGAEVVAAAGTHGKSTTAAMLGWALSGRCDGPFAALVGAHVPQLSHPSLGLHVEGAAAHAPSCRLSIGPVQGAPELGRDRGSMVVEADEYGYMFLGLRPSIAVVPEIDWDHPDQFASEDDIHSAFRLFATNIRPGGFLVLNADSPGCMRLRDSLVSDPSGRFLPFAAARTTRGGHAGPGGPAGAPEHAPVTVATFGEDESADFVMRRAVGGDGRHAVVDFAGVGSVVLGPLRMPGSHNATNACGALVAASAFVALRSGLSGVPLSAEEMMAAAHTLSPKIARFEGLSRRTELLGRVDLGPGLCVEIYDDYAHHPTEIEACIKAMGSSRPQSDPAVDEAMDWPEPSTARGSWGEMGGTWDRKAHDGPLVSVWGDYLAGPVAAAAGCRLATHGSGMSRASALSDHYTGGGWEGRPRVQALHRDFQEPPVQGEGKEGGGPAEQTWAVIQPHTFSRVQAFHDKFVESVRGAARALVMDVYGAREEGNSISASQGLVASMNDDGGVRLARYTGDVSSTIEDIQRQLFSLRTTCAGDSKEPTVVRIVFMGAGDITRASRGLLQALSGSSDGCAVHWAAAEVARDAFHA